MAIRRRTQIEVTIRRMKKRKGWYTVLRWRHPTEGRQQETLGYGVTDDEAEDARAQLEAELRLGRAAKPSAPGSSVYTVMDLVAEFLDHIDAGPGSKSHKARTDLDCESIARLLGPYEVEALTSHHVSRFIALRSKERVIRARQRKGESDGAWLARRAASRNDPSGKPVASTTIRDELATARRAVRWGREAGRHKGHDLPPPHRKAMPKDRRPPRKLTEGEARALIAAAGPYETLVQAGAWSARRPVALFAARVQDCVRVLDDTLPRDDQQMYWRTDKGGESTGWGKLSDPAWRAIRQRVAELGPDVSPTALLWTTPDGHPWSSAAWPKRFAKIAAAAGVENVVFYDLRKHACAQILRATGNAHKAIEYSGHLDVQVFLANYAYALEDDDRGAVRIDWRPNALRLVSTTQAEANGAPGGAPADDE